jgi:putative DNA primase/helicase
MDEETRKAIEIAKEEAGLSFAEDFFTKTEKGKIKSFVPQRMGDYLMENQSFKVIKGNDKKIYHYTNGYYKENGISFINESVVKVLGNLYKSFHLSETLSYIKNSNYIDANDINHEWINFKNGLYNPITKEFKEHTSDIFTLEQLPYEYAPSADCPLFKETLKSKCDNEWKEQVVQEMFGYCFLHDNRFEKAFLLYLL